jgi:hypothetical protein
VEKCKAIVFVYNADSGYFNGLVDVAHKIFSPATYACDLCALTHGAFTARREWTDYLRSLPYAQEFLHSDEFRAKYGNMNCELPAIFCRDDDEELRLLVSADSIRQCRSLGDLKTLIDEQVGPQLQSHT